MSRKNTWLLRILAAIMLLPLSGITPASTARVAAATPDDEIVVISNASGNRGRIILQDPYVQTGYTRATWQSPDLGWQNVALGDLNGDGDAEILASQGGVLKAFDPFKPSSATTVVFEQNVSGGSAWRLIATGDLDGDGRDEIIATNTEGNGEKLRVWRGNATGTTWTEIRNESFGAPLRVVQTGDVDGDGKDDIAVTRDVDKLLKVWKGDNFQVLADSTYSFPFLDIAIGEIFRDSTTKNELAVTRSGVKFYLASYYNWRWTANNTWAELYGEKLYPNFQYLAVGDLNGDSDDEVLLLRSVNDNNTIQLAMRNPSGNSMREFEPTGLGADWQGVKAGDLDGDGRDEPVIIRESMVRFYPQPEIDNSATDINGPWKSAFAVGNVDGQGVSSNPQLGVSPASLSFTADFGGPSPSSQSFTVKNETATGNINWSASVIGGSSWLTVNPSSGVTDPNGRAVSVSANPAGLSPNTYSATIRVSATKNGQPVDGSPKDISVTLNVLAPALTVSPASFTFTAAAGGSPPPSQNLRVSNTGAAGTVNWTASVVSSNTPWLSATPSAGTAPTDVAISVNTVGVSPGTHTGTLRITATTPGTTNSPVDIPVTLTITAPRINVSESSLTWVQDRSQPVSSKLVYITQEGGGSGITWVAGAIPANQWAKWKDEMASNPQAFTWTKEGLQYSGAKGAQTIDTYNWLILSPPTGSTPATMEVSIDQNNTPIGLNHVTIVVDGGPFVANRFTGIDTTALMAEPGKLTQIRIPFVTQ